MKKNVNIKELKDPMERLKDMLVNGQIVAIRTDENDIVLCEIWNTGRGNVDIYPVWKLLTEKEIEKMTLLGDKTTDTKEVVV